MTLVAYDRAQTSDDFLMSDRFNFTGDLKYVAGEV